MYMDEYRRWRAQNLEDEDLAAELASIEGNDDEIRDRFAVDLSFGTAGLRGVIGAGTNRMNIYTVRRATQGLANWLLAQNSDASVAIAYDSRIKSDRFAQEAAAVLAANGLLAYLHPRLEPVPILSFTVREMHAAAGIMVTASHNPAIYNGYKAYGPDGCQLSTDASGAVLAEIEKLDIFADCKTMPFADALNNGMVQYVEDEVLESYYANVKAQCIRPGVLKSAGLKLVYSPLNGAGNLPVRRLLGDLGLSDITVVHEQEAPDGNFPTCPYPNPEIKDTLALGLQLAEKTGADLMLATDPDADRVGIAVRDTAGTYHLLSGNEVGVLLLDYIAAGRLDTGNMPGRPLAVKSIVTTPLTDAVATQYNVEIENVLTGFKYIGEAIARLEAQGKKSRFIFGFEESCGYLPGTYVRDKDGVAAAMLICEMAAWHRSNASSLYEAMQAIYARHGRYLSATDTFEMAGLAGMEKMAQMMAALRAAPPTAIAGIAVATLADYEAHTVQNLQDGSQKTLSLPSSNVLAYTLTDGSQVMVRPSGTEPKIKVYYTTKGDTLAAAQAAQQALSAAMKQVLNIAE